MPTRLSRLASTFAFLSAVALGGCAAEQPEGASGFGLTVGALGDANPLADIKNFRLVVTGGDTQFEAPLAYNGQNHQFWQCSSGQPAASHAGWL